MTDKAKSYAQLRSDRRHPEGHREHHCRQAGRAPSAAVAADPARGHRRVCRLPNIAAAVSPAVRTSLRRPRPKAQRPSSPRRHAGCGSQAGMSRDDEEKEIEATKAPLMEHLIELRSRLIKALIAFFICFIGCFFFAKTIFNILTWPFVWVAGPGERQVHLHRPARIFPRAAQARDVRRGLHLVSDRRHPDLHVRRARALSQRAAGVPAVSRRDAGLLPARRNAGLFPGLADARAILARHAAGRRPTARRRSSCCPRSTTT